MKKYSSLIIGVMFLLVLPLAIVLACSDNNDNHDNHDNHDDHDKHYCSAPLSETRTVDCATGYSGSITETRTKGTYPSCDFGAWEETSNTCTINTYALTVSKAGTGTGSVSGAGTYNYGTKVDVTATADSGSTFGGWSGDCDASGNVLIDGPKTCTATFTKNDVPVVKFTITAIAGDNGSVTPASQEVDSGTTATLTVTPSTGYSATVGGTCPTGTLVGTTYTTGNISANCTVEATFTKIPVNEKFTVTATADDNGTITPTTQEVTPNTTATLTVTPNVGYIATVGGTCGGSLVGTTYTTSAITANCTVIASFGKTPIDSFTLSVEKPGTGSGVVTGAGVYPSGTVVTLTATTDAGSTFDGWSANCPGGVITLIGNTTCTATFNLLPVVPHHHVSGGSIPTVSNPQVLGESTKCGIYVDKYMKKGLKGNDMVAVKKVQVFLNDYMSSGLKVDGIIGVKTDAAIRAFQAKQFDKVLAPWGLDAPTGIFYLTTQTEVNNIMCPPLNLPIPTLIPTNQNPAFPQY